MYYNNEHKTLYINTFYLQREIQKLLLKKTEKLKTAIAQTNSFAKSMVSNAVTEKVYQNDRLENWNALKQEFE